MTSYETAAVTELLNYGDYRLRLRHWNAKDPATLMWYFYGSLELEGIPADQDLTYFADGFVM